MTYKEKNFNMSSTISVILWAYSYRGAYGIAAIIIF